MYEIVAQNLPYLHVKDVYKAFGETVNQTKLEHMKVQMAGFKEKLEEFAMKHR